MNSGDNDGRIERLEQAIALRKAARARPSDLPPRPRDKRAHLGEMQRSLWLTHQMEPHSPAYNLTSAFRCRGILDLSRLQRAFDSLVSRHRILRSTFSVRQDAVEQIVHSDMPITVEALAVGEGGMLEAAIQQARQPFALETGPLIRLILIEESSESESVLLLVLHHILADERSLGILWQELARAYEGQPSDTEPQAQYDDYVHWQRQRDRQDRDDALRTWRRRLDPLPDDLSLPFEKLVTESASPRGRLISRDLSPAVQAAIHHLAAGTGTSPFMVFAFAFRLLLQRYTPGQDYAFATPVSTRSHPATASMIGYFLNPVVVTSRVNEEHTVDQAIRAFAGDLRQVLAQASVPFDELAEVLSPSRQRDRHPIFQTMFVHQEAATPPPFGGLTLEPVMLDLAVSKFDLTLFVTDGDRSLQTAIEYRADRYDKLWMRRLLEHFGTLLENLPRDLQQALSEVPMMAPLELDKLSSEGQGEALNEAEMALLPQQFLTHASRSADSPAVICGGVRRSYGDIESSARSLAFELASRGVAVGDRVGVFLNRSVSMIEAILGCHLAGAAYVPLDPHYPEARNQRVLEDAEVAVVLTTSTLQGRLPERTESTILLDVLDPGRPTTTDLPTVGPETPAYILYTSGSTGHPKGVIISHGNLRASTAARLQVYDTPPLRFLLLPSLAFDSSVAGIFWTLGVGGALVIPTDDEVNDVRQLTRLMSRERVSSLLCVPSLYTQLLSAGESLMQDLNTAIVAGEVCPSRLVDEHFRCLPRARFYNEYGPTEATVWATVHEITPADAHRPVAVGQPIPGVRVDVLDDLGRPVPAGIPGGAWISGPTVAQGYWRHPDLTDERFVPRNPVSRSPPKTTGRSYRTGDQMTWTEDGRLLFLGRDDDQVKLRGFRIEPGEVEAALMKSSDVSAAAVLVRSIGSRAAGDSPAESAHLVAFVESATDQEPASWRQDLANRLPSHMIPARVVSLPELPRLPNGKINRQRLQEMELEPVATAGVSGDILDAQIQTLISLWEGLLARTGIGLDDNFFELGGHSLLVVEMTLAIERDLGATLTAADVFENPTVRQLSRRIAQRRGPSSTPYDHLYPIQPAGRNVPFIVAVPHFFTEMFAQRFRGERPVYGLRGIGLRAEGNLGRWRTLNELGEDLVEEIRRRFPDPPYILAGYSFGASMAIETARIMEARGIRVDRLYLIAPMPEDFYRIGPLRIQLDHLRQPVAQLSFSEALRLYLQSNNPFTLRPYQRAWRRLAIEPWRRLLAVIGKLRKMAGLPLTSRILYADVRVDRFRLHANYQPQPIKTPTVVFNAQETDTDAAETWRPYFQGPYTVVPTPDPHLGDTSVEAAQEIILRHLSELENSRDGQD